MYRYKVYINNKPVRFKIHFNFHFANCRYLIAILIIIYMKFINSRKYCYPSLTNFYFHGISAHSFVKGPSTFNAPFELQDLRMADGEYSTFEL